MKNTTIVDVAYYILGKKPMKRRELQAICFYAQGWYVANHNEFLFDEDFEAWVTGMISPILHEKFKQYGYHKMYIDEERKHSLTDKQRKIIDMTIEKYGVFSEDSLETIMKSEIL